MTPEQFSTQVSNNSVTNKLNVYLAEFSAMRTEIMHVSTKQANFLAISFAVSGYAFTSFEKLHSTPSAYAVISLALCAIGIMFCDMDRAIIRNATYIEAHLRKHISELVGDDRRTTEVLEWETFIRGGSKLQQLPKVRHSPLSAAYQGLLILVPGWVSLFIFLVLSALNVKFPNSLANASVTWHAVISIFLGLTTLASLITFSYRLKLMSSGHLHLPPEWKMSRTQLLTRPRLCELGPQL